MKGKKDQCYKAKRKFGCLTLEKPTSSFISAASASYPEMKYWLNVNCHKRSGEKGTP